MMCLTLISILELIVLAQAWTTISRHDFRLSNTYLSSGFMGISESELRLTGRNDDTSFEGFGDPSSRRSALIKLVASGSFAVATIFARNTIVCALDMDAFITSQLENDTKNCDPKKDSKCKPKLTEDEALCKYGQTGEARGEACKRVKAVGGTVDKPRSEGRSLGGAYAM